MTEQGLVQCKWLKIMKKAATEKVLLFHVLHSTFPADDD